MSRGGWREALLACLCAGALACGDSGPPTSPQPTPAPGRWQGAQAIDGSAPTNPNCDGASAPTAGMDASGRSLGAWLSDCVVAVAGSAQGLPWSAPSPLGGLAPGAPANWLWEPALAVARDGVALVAWAAQETVAEGRQIWSRRLDPAVGWTAAERIDAGESGRLGLPYAPSLALDEAGNGLAVWDSEGVVAARLLATRGWLAPERIAGSPSSVPLAFLDRRGDGFAVWLLRGEVYARRFEAGAGWGETTRFTAEAGRTFFGQGDLAFDPAGQALLVWSQARTSVGPERVWSAAFAAGRWSSGAVVSAGDTRAVNPHVGIDDAGGGIAVWNESQVGIAFARWDRGAWTPPRVAVSAPSGAGPARLAVSAGGDAMVVWRESAASGPGRVFAVRYAAGSWGAREALQASGNQPNDPMVAVDPCGNAVAIWSEYEGSLRRVWGNRFETSCPSGATPR